MTVNVEVNWELTQTFKVKIFAKVVTGFRLSTICARTLSCKTLTNGSCTCFWKFIQNKDKPEAAVCRCSLRCSILRNFIISKRKCLCWSLFFKIKLQAWRPVTYKRDSFTNVFLWILQIFLECLFYRIPPVSASAKQLKINFFIPFVAFQCPNRKLLKNILHLQNFALKLSS